MKKFNPMLIAFLLMGVLGFAQNKYEREQRIKASQFPAAARALLEDYLEDARRLRYYQETDSTKRSYEAKFKRDKLHYSVEFNEQGVLEDIEILIEEVDIPNDSFDRIKRYLDNEFSKYRILRIQQQYPASNEEAAELTLNNAFQNLLLPTINYELMVAGKRDKGYRDFEILFDAEGSFLKLRKSLPPKYDHVLY